MLLEFPDYCVYRERKREERDDCEEAGVSKIESTSCSKVSKRNTLDSSEILDPNGLENYGENR